MKKLLKDFVVLTMIFLLLLVSCSKDDEPKVMSSDDAKIEVRAAMQDMMVEAIDVMDAPAMNALMFLMQLMGFDDIDLPLKSMLSKVNKINPAAFNNFVREEMQLKNLKNVDFEPDSHGIYTFNFATSQFQLTNANVNYLQLIFPGDETAYATQSNNASLTISQFTLVEIQYTDDWGTWTEELPANIAISLEVDSDEVFSFNFQASYNANGMPQSVSMSVDMLPVLITMSWNGSGTNYTTAMTVKENNVVVMNWNLNITYSSSMDDIDFVSGYIMAAPLRFDGSINIAGGNNCDDNDADCINQNIDVQLKQVVLNQVIGHIEFRAYTDPYWGDTYLEPVLVYSDGTWEYLHEIGNFDFK